MRVVGGRILCVVQYCIGGCVPQQITVSHVRKMSTKMGYNWCQVDSGELRWGDGVMRKKSTMDTPTKGCGRMQVLTHSALAYGSYRVP